MRDLSADRGGDPGDVILARDQPGRAFEIVTAAAFDADEINGEDSFPEFGTFIKCRDSRDQPAWVELPQDLEVKIAARGADGGDLEGQVFRVANCRKTADGSWSYSLEWFDSFEAASESLSG